MLWQGQRRCVDALPCNYNEIRSVANIAIAMTAATATPRKEQQLQLQLALFKQLLLLGQVVCFVLLGVFFFFFFGCARSVFLLCSALFAAAAAVAATGTVIFSLRLLQQLQLFFGVPWPKLAMRANVLLLSQLSKYFKQSK